MVDNDRVRRWKSGDKSGTIVVDGNDERSNLNQLSKSDFILIDHDYSIYISDGDNHRIMKRKKRWKRRNYFFYWKGY